MKKTSVVVEVREIQETASAKILETASAEIQETAPVSDREFSSSITEIVNGQVGSCEHFFRRDA